MVKSAATVGVETDPAIVVLAAAADTYREQNSRMTDAERKKIEKEILGLKAKMRWDHISADVKKGYAARIAELEAKLAAG